jgi:hypothetical protein
MATCGDVGCSDRAGSTNAEFNTGADAEPNTGADAEPNTRADAEPNTRADAEPNTAADAEPNTEADAEPNTEADAELNTEADAELNTEADAELNTLRVEEELERTIALRCGTLCDVCFSTRLRIEEDLRLFFSERVLWKLCWRYHIFRAAWVSPRSVRIARCGLAAMG